MGIGVIPIIVMDVSDSAYFRDYLNHRKTYVMAMMKELNWPLIEARVVRAEKIAKIPTPTTTGGVR